MRMSERTDKVLLCMEHDKRATPSVHSHCIAAACCLLFVAAVAAVYMTGGATRHSFTFYPYSVSDQFFGGNISSKRSCARVSVCANVCECVLNVPFLCTDIFSFYNHSTAAHDNFVRFYLLQREFQRDDTVCVCPCVFTMYSIHSRRRVALIRRHALTGAQARTYTLRAQMNSFIRKHMLSFVHTNSAFSKG